MACRLFRRDNHPGAHVRIRSLHRPPKEPPMQLARPVAREKKGLAPNTAAAFRHGRTAEIDRPKGLTK